MDQLKKEIESIFDAEINNDTLKATNGYHTTEKPNPFIEERKINMENFRTRLMIKIEFKQAIDYFEANFDKLQLMNKLKGEKKVSVTRQYTGYNLNWYKHNTEDKEQITLIEKVPVSEPHPKTIEKTAPAGQSISLGDVIVAAGGREQGNQNINNEDLNSILDDVLGIDHTLKIDVERYE